MQAERGDRASGSGSGPSASRADACAKENKRRGVRRSPAKQKSEMAPKATPPAAPPKKMANPMASFGGGRRPMAALSSHVVPSAEPRLLLARKERIHVTKPSRTHVSSEIATK
eukprot:CAMPEP_0182842194 /NCGR_PEP_ID=MMETSP0006_2-20121128/25481_1 /TAXON_ID=97485 /ORGANISM="Prymnesium parvum, Strain Texoma1" /LENGTH=112 /DNA_ID=CAMNT_0024971817 /DNA_START=391 /DNA_END=729 /DNA_ORIENTATION=-